jgi:hypothetical protein
MGAGPGVGAGSSVRTCAASTECAAVRNDNQEASLALFDVRVNITRIIILWPRLWALVPPLCAACALLPPLSPNGGRPNFPQARRPPSSARDVAEHVRAHGHPVLLACAHRNLEGAPGTTLVMLR